LETGLQGRPRQGFGPTAQECEGKRRTPGRDRLGLQPQKRRRVLHRIRLQGLLSHYYPDFIARARIGEVFHNFIIEVKGRYDERRPRRKPAAASAIASC